MASVFSWIKNHKLVSLLSLIIIFLLFGKSLSTNDSASRPQTTAIERAVGGNYEPAAELQKAAAPAATSVKDRLVIKESNLSLLVNKVVEAQKNILQKIEEMGGYMVSSNLTNPQDTAAATVIVRIPVKKFDQALDYFRSISVKVISENLQGEDVTDQYVDLQARLETLNKTKLKFEQIMDKASQIQDILDVQRELINLQSQIDDLKGQQQYLEKSAQMAKVTLYLSTDELSLPYAPSEAWRPQAIFKQATRSLVGTLRALGTLVIWVAVYAVVWVPILIIIIFLRRRKRT